MGPQHINAELQYLQYERKKLVAEEKWLLDMLNKIKTSQLTLEIEKMQLMNFLKGRPENVAVSPTPEPIDVQSLDNVQSSINTEELDLSIAYNPFECHTAMEESYDEEDEDELF